MSKGDPIKSALLGCFIVLAIVGCKAEPTEVVEIPYPHNLEPTPTLCCKERGFPPACDILPGRSRSEDVEKALGTPAQTAAPDANVWWCKGQHIPGALSDSCWLYPEPCSVIVYFSEGVVSAIVYDLPPVPIMTVEQAVEEYGTPDKIVLTDYNWPVHEPDKARYELVGLVWPSEGVILTRRLPAGIKDAQALPPFRARSSLLSVWYFEPIELDESVVFFDAEHDQLADWPGMIAP